MRILNDAGIITGDTIDLDVTPNNEITGARSRLENDLRSGDVLTTIVSDYKGKFVFELKELILLKIV